MNEWVNVSVCVCFVNVCSRFTILGVTDFFRLIKWPFKFSLHPYSVSKCFLVFLVAHAQSTRTLYNASKRIGKRKWTSFMNESLRYYFSLSLSLIAPHFWMQPDRKKMLRQFNQNGKPQGKRLFAEWWSLGRQTPWEWDLVSEWNVLSRICIATTTRMECSKMEWL